MSASLPPSEPEMAGVTEAGVAGFFFFFCDGGFGNASR